MADITEPTAQEIDRNLQTVDKILNPNPSNAEIYAAILAIRRDLKPLTEFFSILPEAIEANPMMKILLGKMAKSNGK